MGPVERVDRAGGVVARLDARHERLDDLAEAGEALVVEPVPDLGEAAPVRDEPVAHVDLVDAERVAGGLAVQRQLQEAPALDRVGVELVVGTRAGALVVEHHGAAVGRAVDAVDEALEAEGATVGELEVDRVARVLSLIHI